MRKIFSKTVFVAFLALLVIAMTACKQQGGDNVAKKEQPAAAKTVEKAQEQEAETIDDEGWTFATVPLPDGSNPPRFVSNPDGILTLETEAELNRILLYAKVELGVEARIVVVNHVYNSDVESFAFALFENYKPNENMLVIVIAYQDKGVRMEIGHDLDAKLSEVEGQQLMNNILIPYLREDNPDEGVLTLVETLYHKLEGKTN